MTGMPPSAMSTPSPNGADPASKPKSILYAACVRLADERCGNEHDDSCDKCRHARIRQDFIESSRYCSPICVGTFKATSAPLRKRGILRIGTVKWS
jgi:hypothetical protein